MKAQMVTGERLANFPISFFAVVMGLSGLTLAWQKAQHVWGVNLGIHIVFLLISMAVFGILLVTYLNKLRQYPEAVKQEMDNPVKLSFFPAISISFLLISTALSNISLGLAAPFWWLGATLHLAFTFYVIGSWMHQERYQIMHMTPAWFIPAVGNILVPVVGVELGHQETSWFFFSIGLIFWIILMVIVFYRMVFHTPIDERLLPTLFILIAPPAIGFISYVKLGGELDNFARILYYAGLFFTFLLLTQVRRFSRLPFFLSWWAYSFPAAAITIATFIMYEQTGLGGFAFLANVFLLMLTVLIALLVSKTLKAVKADKICIPGH